MAQYYVWMKFLRGKCRLLRSARAKQDKKGDRIYMETDIRVFPRTFRVFGTIRSHPLPLFFGVDTIGSIMSHNRISWILRMFENIPSWHCQWRDVTLVVCLRPYDQCMWNLYKYTFTRFTYNIIQEIAFVIGEINHE